MQALPMSAGRSQPIRLSDVDIVIRRRYGRVLLDRALKEMDPIAALEFGAELHRAVEQPSDRIYWVPTEAARRVLG